jgi:hypothetical protein
MRRLHFDQYEFDSPDSEQSLEVVISSPRQHDGLKAFLSECRASSDVAPPPAPGWDHWPSVTENLRSLAGVVLPEMSQWREGALFRDEWDDVEVAIAAGPFLVWYHWLTTA